MKSKKLLQISLMLILSIFFIQVTDLILNHSTNYIQKSQSLNSMEDLNELTQSGYWNLSNIYINNNWSDTANDNDWCTFKNGFYIIENVTITGGLYGKNGIYIENTTESFMIRNCRISEGIALKSVQSGQIINNNITLGTIQYITGLDNKLGIYMDSCSNITIKSNIVNDPYNPRDINTYAILLKYSNNTILKNNFISTNSSPFHWWGHFGIRISGKKGSHNIEVINNMIRDSDYGITLSGCESSKIINNTIWNNYFGIDVSYSDSSQIINNNICCSSTGLDVRGNNYIIANNSIKNIKSINRNAIWAYCNSSMFSYNSIQNGYGFYFYGSFYNVISNNIIEDSDEYGIEMKNSEYNNITYNSIHRSRKGGIYLIRSNYSIITNNFINSRSECVQEIDCYGNIISDNICQQITTISGYFPWMILGILMISVSLLLKLKLETFRKKDEI